MNFAARYLQFQESPKKVAALLRKPDSSPQVTTRATPVTALANDKVGVCPFCQGQMEKATIHISHMGGPVSVFMCEKDRYVAPMPNAILSALTPKAKV